MAKVKEQIPFIMLDNRNDSLPLYRQIYEAIQKGILSGEFAAKMQLPSTRFLAQDLGVSRITIVNAYEQLFAEGYLEGKTGAGTFVASELPENLLQIKAVKENSKKSPRTAASPVGLRRKNIEKRCLDGSMFGAGDFSTFSKRFDGG